MCVCEEGNSGGVLVPSLWRPSEDYDPGCFSLLSVQFPEWLLKVSAAAVNKDKQSVNLWKTHSCFAAPLVAGINILLPALSMHLQMGCNTEVPGLWYLHGLVQNRHIWRWFRKTRWTPKKGTGSPACAWLVAHPGDELLLTHELSVLFTEESKTGLHYVLLRHLWILN